MCPPKKTIPPDPNAHYTVSVRHGARTLTIKGFNSYASALDRAHRLFGGLTGVGLQTWLRLYDNKRTPITLTELGVLGVFGSQGIHIVPVRIDPDDFAIEWAG